MKLPDIMSVAADYVKDVFSKGDAAPEATTETASSADIAPNDIAPQAPSSEQEYKPITPDIKLNGAERGLLNVKCDEEPAPKPKPEPAKQVAQNQGQNQTIPI